jgi:DNA-directed RNA polymerase specialized sigma24 family protein
MDDLLELLKAYRRASKNLKLRTRAAEEFVTFIAPLLEPFIIRQVGHSAAEDLLQESLLAIVKGLREVEAHSDQKLLAWCYRITKNKISDFMRQKYRDPLSANNSLQIEEMVQLGSQENRISAGDKHDLDFLLTLLRKSKFPCDEVLWNHIVFGMNIEEIGFFYGVAYDAARMKIKRCFEAARGLAGSLR